MAALEAQDRADWTAVTSDPLSDLSLDPSPGFIAELAPVPPQPTYVDPDEWARGGRYL